MSDQNTVKVTSRRWFRGQNGEGEAADGWVKPGDVLRLTRQRAAELKANGIVTDPIEASGALPVASDPATPPAAPATPPPPAAPAADLPAVDPAVPPAPAPPIVDPAVPPAPAPPIVAPPVTAARPAAPLVPTVPPTSQATIEGDAPAVKGGKSKAS